jgi:hypothetical protein
MTILHIEKHASGIAAVGRINTGGLLQIVRVGLHR